ncbi:hypothetical protein AAF712_003178 [Marasmius tenuissimus]|uniref:Uncharacterized protein n=1 Tax=Marasmius tenuissimus TaxID=585030 RepID=A0ABR3A8I6_9AGAR
MKVQNAGQLRHVAHNYLNDRSPGCTIRITGRTLEGEYSSHREREVVDVLTAVQTTSRTQMCNTFVERIEVGGHKLVALVDDEVHESRTFIVNSVEVEIAIGVSMARKELTGHRSGDQETQGVLDTPELDQASDIKETQENVVNVVSFGQELLNGGTSEATGLGEEDQSSGGQVRHEDEFGGISKKDME